MEGGSVFGASCNLKFDTKQFYGVTAAANLSPHQGRQKRNIIVVVAVSIICLILVTCFCLWRIKSKAKTAGNGDEVKSLELQVRLETIRAATCDFSDENKLGQGGFGAVYKGKFTDGQEIAVKRLSQHSSQGDAEFKNEVMLLAKLQHKNLVKLLGFCLQGQERLLIYEYVPNASLDKFLSDPIKRTSLNWDTRYKIIKGIARGLLYLHEDSRLRVIHRDLKTSNILLDADLNPKIADFGMARLFFMDQTHSETKRIVGTYGYMPPEYAIHGQFSTKSDVYSFGVIIVELITGHKISSFTVRGASENLTSFLEIAIDLIQL
uniref:Protein kinase domain-containing protein n=1 Tax=Kalanchoe fedtschenkoi TaxID=63787 RepID=A0A7N0UWZ9_KALFE